MANAPGASSHNIAGSRLGRTRWGRPDGSWPTTLMPAASPPSRLTRIVATTATTSAEGMRGGKAGRKQNCYRAQGAGQHRGEWSISQMLQQEPEFHEEIARGAADAQQMGHL